MLPWLGLALIIRDRGPVHQGAHPRRTTSSATPPPSRRSSTSCARTTPGAAFPLAAASGWQRWLFTGIGIVATLFIVYLLRTHAGQKLFSFALACILGGAIGNVIDRLLHGYVVDFLQFHWQNRWYFPAFNVADAAITVGAACLILDELLRVAQPLRCGGGVPPLS